MRLKVQVEKINAASVDIAWFAGLNNHGIVTVQIAQSEFRCAIAELTAARFLILDKQVFGRLPNSGKGLALIQKQKTLLRLMLHPILRLRLQNLAPSPSVTMQCNATNKDTGKVIFAIHGIAYRSNSPIQI